MKYRIYETRLNIEILPLERRTKKTQPGLNFRHTYALKVSQHFYFKRFFEFASPNFVALKLLSSRVSNEVQFSVRVSQRKTFIDDCKKKTWNIIVAIC